MTPEDKRVLFQAAVSLMSVCLGALFGARFAIVVADRNAKHAAGVKLRSAFAPELALLRATPSVDRTSLKQILADPQTDLDRVLQAALPRHATAVAEYRFYVPVSARADYDAAWRAYYVTGGGIEFRVYMVGQGASELFCERVEAICRFSEMELWALHGGWLPKAQASASRALRSIRTWRKPGRGPG